MAQSERFGAALSVPTAVVGMRFEGRPDLVDILRGDWPKRTCEGAACGLAVLRAPDVVDDVLRARRDRRITSSCAGSVVATLPGAPALVTERLAGGDDCKEDIAIEAAVSLSARSEGLADRALAEAVRGSLGAGRVKVSPRIRRMLGERAARSLGARLRRRPGAR